MQVPAPSEGWHSLHSHTRLRGAYGSAAGSKLMQGPLKSLQGSVFLTTKRCSLRLRATGRASSTPRY